MANTDHLVDVFDATTLANVKRLMVVPFGDGSLTPFTDSQKGEIPVSDT